MHSNSKGLSTLVLGAVLSTFALAATSAQATTVSGVSVAEGSGYTNVTVNATLADAGATLQYKVFDLAGTQIGDTIETTAASQVIELDAAAKGKTYYYEVSVKDAEPESKAGAYFGNFGWQTNTFFKAVASPKAYQNGTWSSEPSIESEKFQISGTDVSFNLTTTARGDNHDIVDFRCKASIDSCYLLDDITNDVTGAIGGIALVTNEEESASAKWYVLKEGTAWVASSDGVEGDYDLRMELDYNTTPAKIRYSYKLQSADAWSVLSVGGSEWVAATNDTANVAKVCFAGQTAVSKFGAKLSTKAVADVNGVEQNDILTALSVAKANDKAVVLLTNAQVDPRQLVDGTYTFDKNNKSFAVNSVTWKESDVFKTDAVWTDDTTLKVSKNLLVAKIGEVVYTALAEAFGAASAGQTVVAITNIAESATSTVDSVTLDLADFALTGVGTAPALVVKGSNKVLYLPGGAIRGSTTGISAEEGAKVYVDGAFVTNNTTAIAADDSSTVVISNGVFTGQFSSTGLINILGGYIVGATLGNAKATGGKFVNNVENVPANGYKYAPFAVNVTTNGYTFAYEVMTNATGSSEADTKVWSVADSNGEKSIGGVQIPNTWIEANVSAKEAEAQQTELNTTVPYAGGGKVKKWEAYVLGIPTSEEKKNEGPVVTGVQDANADQLTFKIMSPELIKAKESGCDVKFEVEAYDNPDFTGDVEGTTGNIDYDKSAGLDLPSKDDGVRYFKLKMHISTKK